MYDEQLHYQSAGTASVESSLRPYFSPLKHSVSRTKLPDCDPAHASTPCRLGLTLLWPLKVSVATYILSVLLPCATPPPLRLVSVGLQGKDAFDSYTQAYSAGS